VLSSAITIDISLDTPHEQKAPSIGAPCIGAPCIGVVKFPVASLDHLDAQNAERIRLITSRNIGLSKKLSVIPIDVLDKFLAWHEISILNLYSAEEIEKIPIDFVQYLVTGFISVDGKNYRININLLDIKKREFISSEEMLIDNEPPRPKGANIVCDGY
jgi:hypothetical protein